MADHPYPMQNTTPVPKSELRRNRGQRPAAPQQTQPRKQKAAPPQEAKPKKSSKRPAQKAAAAPSAPKVQPAAPKKSNSIFPQPTGGKRMEPLTEFPSLQDVLPKQRPTLLSRDGRGQKAPPIPRPGPRRTRDAGKTCPAKARQSAASGDPARRTCAQTPGGSTLGADALWKPAGLMYGDQQAGDGGAEGAVLSGY